MTPLLSLVLRGPVLDGGFRRVLEAFAAQATVVLERERLRSRAEEARRLEAGDAMRRTLLAAVSHDLRTPLASIKRRSPAFGRAMSISARMIVINFWRWSTR